MDILDEKEKVGRAYAQVIDRASGKCFRPFFEAYVDKNAQIVTDEWKGYLPLKKDSPNLKQVPSDKGKNFKQLHIHINYTGATRNAPALLKNALAGLH